MRCVFAVVLSAVVLAGGAATAVDAQARPRLLIADDSTAFAVRPSSVILGADGGVLLGKLFSGHRRGYLRWSHWGSRSASGTATYWFKTCAPDCQHSRLQLRHVNVLAFRPRDGHFLWLRLRMHFEGRLWTERLHAERDADAWSWVTPEGFVEGASRHVA